MIKSMRFFFGGGVEKGIGCQGKSLNGGRLRQEVLVTVLYAP